MENNTVKIKFPVGAIFMIAYAILLICNSIIGYLNFWGIINALSYATIAAMAIMKKRGLPILVPSAVITLITLIGFSVSSILYLVALILVLLLCLDDMKIGNLSNFRSIFAKAFIVSISLYTILKVVLDVINVWTNPDRGFPNPWFVIIEYILLPVSMLFVGLWINDPYKKIKQNDDAVIRDNYYVSLGKHICLLIFTFGIWQMIWIYKTTHFTNCAKEEETRNPTTKLLLYLFVPFYSIYWTYKSAQRIDMIAKDSGIGSDLRTVCLILAIFIGIVPPILMQDKINEIIKKNSISSVNEDVVL